MAAAAVARTNDQAATCKLSMCKLGYSADRFLPHFVAQPSRRTPVTNRGYFLRAAAFDSVLTAFLDGPAGRAVQVVSLGAGFDTAVFRAAEAGLAPTRWLELDLPEVVSRKQQIVADTGLAELVAAAGCAYSIRAADLAEAEGVLAVLEAADIDRYTPTLLMSEVATAYVDGEAVARLDSQIFARFSQAALLLWEPQLLTSDAFGVQMERFFRQHRTPLRCLERFPDGQARAEWLLECGCDRVSWRSGFAYWQHTLSEAERARVAAIEPFDEAEELHLKGHHYYLLCARRGCSWLESSWSGGSSVPSEHDVEPQFEPTQLATRTADMCVSWRNGSGTPSTEAGFWGHGCALLPGSVLVYGGYGKLATDQDGAANRRLGQLLRLGPAGLELVSAQTDCPGARVFHSFTGLGRRQAVLFGGRTSPARALSDSWVWDETEQSWTEFQRSGPSGRFRHAAVGVPGGAVLLHGGRGSQPGVVFDDWWRFEISTGWQEVATSKPTLARYDHSLTLDKERNRVLLYGGLSAAGNPSCQLFQLELGQSDNACEFKPVECVNSCSSRHGHAAAIWRDHFMVVGGVSGSIVGQDELICILDLQNMVWSAVPGVGLGVQPFWVNHAVVCSGDSLLILGGGAHCFAFGALFNEPISELKFSPYFKSVVAFVD